MKLIDLESDEDYLLDGKYNIEAGNTETAIGTTCYKIYVTAERWRFPNSYWNYFCDTVSCLEYWKKHILHGGQAALYVKARPFTRSDKIKLGKTVFWSKHEAEEAIGISYGKR